MKRMLCLAAAVLVAMLMIVPSALAQGTTGPKQNLPASGGPAIGSVLLPAGALLLGSGVLVYAVIRRRP